MFQHSDMVAAHSIAQAAVFIWPTQRTDPPVSQLDQIFRHNAAGSKIIGSYRMDGKILKVLYENQWNTGFGDVLDHVGRDIAIICNNQTIHIAPHQLTNAVEGINCRAIDMQEHLVTQFIGGFLDSRDNPKVESLAP